MKRLIPILFLILVVTACNKKSYYPPLDEYLFKNLGEVETLYSYESPDSLNLKMEAKAVFLPEIEGYPSLVKLNKLIKNNALSSKDNTTLYYDNFQKEYYDFVTDFDDDIPDWYIDRYSGFYAWTNSTVTIITMESSYAGGAHDNSYKILKTYDTASAHELVITDIVTDIKAIADIAYRFFVKEKGLAPDVRLEDTIYQFENNKFKLSENFSISKQFLCFIYNPYEVAPYSEGEIKLLIPIEDCLDYLNQDIVKF